MPWAERAGRTRRSGAWAVLVSLAVALAALAGCGIGRPLAAPSPDRADGRAGPAFVAAVDDILARRSAALAGGDAAAWRATGAAPGAFAALRGLGVVRLERGAAVPGAAGSLPPAAAAPGATGGGGAPGPGADRVGTVTWRYVVPGVDRGTTGVTQTWRVRVDPTGRARVVGLSGAPQVWDLPGVAVRRAEGALAVGDAAPADLAGVARLASAVRADVARRWRGRPPPPLLLLVPRTAAGHAALAGTTPARLARVAATTVGESAPGRPAAADRVLVHPEAWAQLTPRGRRVVLTHEAVHVARRAGPSGPDARSRWFTEGVAEYLAYRDSGDSGLEPRRVAAPLLRRVRETGPPADLPTDAAFDPGAANVEDAYAQAWLACRALVRLAGEEAVLDLAAAPGPAGEPDLGRLRIGRDRLVTAWRADLADLAAPAAPDG